MKELNETQLDFLKDMLKSEGWKIYEDLLGEQITNHRKVATRKDIKLEDRLWESAVAQGQEEAIRTPLNYFN